jgi:hypothetical protein
MKFNEFNILCQKKTCKQIIEFCNSINYPVRGRKEIIIQCLYQLYNSKTLWDSIIGNKTPKTETEKIIEKFLCQNDIVIEEQ